MRTTFDELRLSGFGRFSDLTIKLSAGLNLLVGANEAGKSTLFGFIRAVLYGFERRQSPLRFEPRSGGAFGGELVISAGGQRFIVSRVGSKRRVEGELTLRDLEGTPLPESSLVGALGGVNRALFSQVFSVTLDELREFESLTTESAVAEALFAAGAQGATRVPVALSELEQRAFAVWSAKAHKRPLNVELAMLDETRTRLAGVAQRPEAWVETVEMRERLAGEEQGLRDDVAALRARVSRAELLSRCLPLVREALSLASSSAPLEQYDTAALTRLELLEPRRVELSRAYDELCAACLRWQRRVTELKKGLKPPAAVAEASAAVSAWQSIAPTARRLSGREQGLLERRGSLEQRAKRVVGKDVPSEWLMEVDAGASRVAELQAFRTKEQVVGSELGRAEDEVRLLSTELERVTQARVMLERTAPVASRAELEEQTLAAQAVIDLTHEHDDRRAKARAVLERAQLAQPPEAPAANLWGGGLLWASVVVLWGGTGLTAWRASANFALAFATVACSLTTLLVVLRHASARAAESRQGEFERRQSQHVSLLGSSRHEAAALNAAADELARARQAAARVARVDSPAEARALLGQLAWWRREAEDYERTLRERQQLDEAGQALALRRADASTRLAAAHAQLDAIQTEVDARTTSLGFPAGLRAQQAIDLLNETMRLQDEELALRRDEVAHQGESRLVQQATVAVAAAASAFDLPGDDSIELVAERLAGALAAAARDADALAEAAIRLDDCQRQHERVGVELKNVEAQIASQLEPFRAIDAAHLRALVAQADAQAARARRRAELEVQVQLMCGGSLEEVAAELARVGEPARLVDELRASLAALEARHTDTVRSLGEVRERLLGLETETLAARLRGDEAAQVARCTRLAQACAVATLARAVLQRSRQQFEAQHQPRVVRRASELLAQFSDRRYPSLHVDAATRSLTVRDNQGVPWPVAQLSRGTRELLLLAFRLAVVEDFGRSRVHLPVVLDDVLVNVDHDRAWRLVEALARLAKDHQIIALTCHPHIRNLFRAVRAQITAVQQQTQLSLLAD